MFGPSVGKKCTLFVDDLSMPLPEKYGAQPPIELLRQWIDHNYWYDLQAMSRIDILDMVSERRHLRDRGDRIDCVLVFLFYLCFNNNLSKHLKLFINLRPQ